MRTPPALLLLVCLLPACRDDEKVEDAPPTGLEPLEENLAEAPEEGAEELSVTGGETEDYAWAHARAWVQADLATTWAAFADPDVVVDRRRMESWEAEMDVADYDVSFLIHHVTDDLLTVEYDLTWIQGATAGTAEAPEEVGIRWSKTGGTELVYLLEGSALLRESASGHTEVQIIEHLDTPSSGPEDIEAYFEDLFASVLASVRGEPLPTYE